MQTSFLTRLHFLHFIQEGTLYVQTVTYYFLVTRSSPLVLNIIVKYCSSPKQAILKVVSLFQYHETAQQL